MRKTKIVCTIGPACDSEERMRSLIEAGMNVARFNFSHDSHVEHGEKFKRLRKVRIEMNRPIATLLDTRGPEIRLHDFEGGGVLLEQGQKFTLVMDEILGSRERASVNYPGMIRDVKVGSQILMDDGLIGLHVDNITDEGIECTVENGGPISNHKGINLPGADLSMPFISDKDREDILFGCDMGFDFIACSFTRTAEDILEVRKILDSRNSHMKVIAKIESVQAVRNLEEILEVADGVMVARGDLGVEVPLEEVPILQKRIILAARNKGRICITATQMLDSMMHHPRPTRAETTDVANAIYDGTTAIMLSGETAAGDYPIEALRTMSRIAERTEKDINYRKRRDIFNDPSMVSGDTTSAICHASCTVAEEIGAKAIVTVTISGFTAERLQRLRPSCPIIACTTDVRVACQMNMLFGVVPLLIKMEESTEELFDEALELADKTGLISSGDHIVTTAGLPLGSSGNTNMIRVLELN